MALGTVKRSKLLSVAFSSMWIFSVGRLDNAVRTRDEMQVVYKEMTRDGAKSNLAKWNLIGGIQFKHVKIASPPECYRNVKSWPMNYKHNSFKKVRSAVLPHTHFLTLGGFGVVWKFYFSSIWDDSRVTALWLNWTFKIMGNSCSSCGGKITEGNYCERFVHLAFILVQAAFQGKFTRIE